MFTAPSTANIKYLVKISRDGAINAKQLRMLHAMKRWGLEKEVRSKKVHTASLLLLSLRYWQLIFKELLIFLPVLAHKQGIWNEKIFRFVASHLEGEGLPLVSSHFFSTSQKHLPTFVVGTEVGENSTACDITCGYCQHPVWFLQPCTTVTSQQTIRLHSSEV